MASALLLGGIASLPAQQSSPATSGTTPAKPRGDYTFPFSALPPGLKTEDNVVYKKIDGQELALTMFYPAVKKFDRAPLVVYIHGGGWGRGNRFTIITSGFIDVFRQLNDAGFVGAAIEYRLADGHGSTAYDAVADCKDAIHFLVKNAARFGIDPNRIGTIGGSAGGHLSLVTALGSDADYPCDPELAKYPGKILAEAAYFPLISFVDTKMFVGSNFARIQRLVPLLGGTLEEKRAIAEKLSPALRLKKEIPAILLAHGYQDRVLNVVNSTTFAELCQQKGVPVECIIVKGADHGFRGDNIQPSQAEITARTTNFFLKYLLPPGVEKPASAH